MRIYLSIICSFLLGSVFGQMTYVVNSTDDTDDGVCDGVHCSLYEAVNSSNNDNVSSKIMFNMPNSDTIFLSDSLYLYEPHTQFFGLNTFNGNKITLSHNSQFNLYVLISINSTDIEIENVSFNAFTSEYDGYCHLLGVPLLCLSSIIKIVNSNNILLKNNDFNGQTDSSLGIINSTNINVTNNTFTTGNLHAGYTLPVDIGYQVSLFDTVVNLAITGNTFKRKTEFFSMQGVIIPREDFSNIEEFSSGIKNFENSNISQVSINNNQFTDFFIGIDLNCANIDSLYVINNTFKECRNAIDQFITMSSYISYCSNIQYSKLFFNENTFSNNQRAIRINSTPNLINNLDLSSNIYTCNQVSNILKINASNYNSYYRGPTISYINETTIQGSSDANAIIELYYADTCNTVCQGLDLINIVSSDLNGEWLAVTPSDFKNSDEVTALQVDTLGRYSNFSSCYIVQPDACKFSEILPIELNPCSTTGSVLDLDQMTASTPAPKSAFSNSFLGKDAWYKAAIPPTGNLLIRSNINNQVSPVIEIYKGDCNNLIIQGAVAFNETIQEMVFEGLTPNDTLYLRVWDNNNLKVNAGESLLHLTAHELGVNKDEWEICDKENAYLLGNPTIISEKDANSFILEFPKNATQSDISSEESTLIAQGLVKEDECLCGQNPLQLWKAGNPVDMETRRKSAIGRGNVDTVNYNYIFEAQEFQVNAYAIGQQYDTDVSMDPYGNFVMCWIDEQRRHNYARLYNSSGNPVTQEFRVGDRDDTQYSGRISIEDDGDFITVWHETNGNTSNLYGRQYNADASAKAAQFDISTSSANSSSNQNIKDIAKYGVNGSVDTDADGDFIVAWHVGSRIFVQRFSDAAKMQDTIMEVGETIDNNISPKPSISVNSNGEFIIVWNGEDTEDNGIYTQRYDSNGAPQGSATLVNTIETHNQINPDVTLFDNGSYVITWQSFGQEGAGLDYGIYMRRFDSSGSAIGPETLVNTYTTNAQKNPSISGFDDGRFFIAWDSYDQDGSEEGVYGQLFATNGSPLGDEFKLNTFTDPEQEEPSTATNGTNLLIGSWVDGANDGSYKGIFAQRYEIAGPKAIPIGTATPSFLLGEEVAYTPIIYSPTDSVSRVRVAIVDTGIDPGHPYLSKTIWNNQQVTGTGCHSGDIMGYDYYNNTNNPLDVDGHGTQVNGIVAQNFNPEIQLEMMNVKFHEADKGKVFDALCGLYYAVDNGADIINLSWGFEASEYPSILNKALSYAADSNDVLIITTAGNTSKNNDIVHKYPANLDIENMIVVTAYETSSTTGNIRLANYASYGENNVDIAAPGFVETTNLGNTLSLSAGTSLAAPWVTHTAATIRGLYPVLTAADVKDCIMSTAKAEAGLLDRVLSDGILDHNAALACAHDKAMDCMGIDLFITVNQNIDTTYRSDAWVNSDATVTNNSDVKMYGAEYVGLHAGFEVEPGAEYLADIDDCAPNNEPMDFAADASDEVLFTITAHSPSTGKIKSKFYSDGINPVSITVKGASGSNLLNWESDVLEKGWYEKIIDVADVKSGDYEIVFEGKEYLASKRVLLKKENQVK